MLDKMLNKTFYHEIHIGLVKERDYQVEFSPRKIEKGYNLFFQPGFFLKEIKERDMNVSI